MQAAAQPLRAPDGAPVQGRPHHIGWARLLNLGGGKVFQCWDQGVQGMKSGGTRNLVIPATLGYGARGAGGVSFGGGLSCVLWEQVLQEIAPMKTASIKFTVTLCAAALGSSFTVLPVWAAATADEITREALLRGYTRQEAERRYKESKSLTEGASKPVGAALASGLSGLAANAQRRMDESNALDDRLWFAVENGLDFQLKNQGELDAMKSLLKYNVEGSGKNYNFYARRRQVEYALHLRPQSEHFFPNRHYAEAARLARMNAYARADFHPYAALTLAKLYLTGRGVPQDEGEARYLIDLCNKYAPQDFRPNLVDRLGCIVMDAQMHRQGWGGPVNPAGVQIALKEARRLLPAELSNSLSDEALIANYR